MKIAVDAMGGDYAPAVVMEAIQSVLKEIPDVEILLVGHKEKLSYYMDFVVIGSLSRELPKAEGVAIGRNISPHSAHLAAKLTSTASGGGLPRSRQDSPTT